MQLVGTTYGIEMVNGIDFLVRTAKLAPGDKVGIVHQDGDFGANSLAGARFATQKAGLQLVEQTVKPTDKDMTPQVTALAAAGVKAVLFAGTPGQTASLVGVAAATGLKVPVLANSPAFVPELLATPVKPALEKMLYISAAQPALNSPIPGVAQLVADYQQKYPNQPLNGAAELGAVNAKLLTDTLKAACQAKDLSREGITTALRTLKQFDNGLGSTQDYSDPAKPPPARPTSCSPPTESPAA
ncbi:hypothetical protein GCM10025734_74210 [Kitasatospora paranensis]